MLPRHIFLQQLLLCSTTFGGKFWHITDLHLDWDYVAGGNTKEMCHRWNSTDPGVGPAGNYSCDAPEVLIMAMLNAMQRIEPNPDFILWTGDSGPHIWSPPPTIDYITNVTKTVFTELDQLFPRVAVFPALGNHDSDPPDTFYDYANQTSPNGTQYDKYWKAGAFGDHIGTGENMRNTFKRCGYYMKPFTTKKGHTIRFIVLNTVLYYNNKAVEEEPVTSDPCNQLNWLEARLNETLATEDGVYIAAHVPPGTFERNPTTSNFFNTPARYIRDIEKRFLELISRPRFAERIHAHFYGHVHTDSYRLFLDRATRQEARGVAFLSSSATPLLNDKNRNPIGVDPGMRLFEFSDDDGTLLDYKQYGISLNEFKAGVSQEDGVVNKSRRKQDPVDPELVPTTLPPDTTVLPTRGKRQENSSDSSRQNVAILRVNSTDDFTNALLSKSADQFSQSAKLLGMEQNSEANKSTTNAAEDKSLLDKKAAMLPASSSVVLPTGNGSNTSAVVPELVKQLADQFHLVYTARNSFSIQNLTAAEMFKAFKTMATKQGDGSQNQMFQDYYLHNTNGHQIGDGKCDAVCVREHLCTISNIIRDELVRCLNSSEDFLLYSPGLSNVTAPTTSRIAPAPLTDKSFSDATTTSTVLPPPVTTTARAQTVRLLRPTQPTLPPEVKLLSDEDGNTKTIHGGSDDAVQAKPIQAEDITTKATAIFFSLLGLVILVAVGVFAFKRYKANRYRNQEFLLTDSVFRYDGYSQLDDF